VRLFVGLLVVVPSLLLPASVPASTTGLPLTVDVSPDPTQDLYVGTGGLVIPESRWRGGGDGRSEAAACRDCQWDVTLQCTKGEYAAGRCRSITLGCPVGTLPVRIWLLRPGQDWDVVGQACLGDTPPATVADVASRLSGRAVVALPPLRAEVQPAEGVLLRVPALFRTGQPAQGIRDADLSVLGLDVRLTSRVRWHWSYGDGTAEWTTSPGGAWPDASVSHAYAVPGRLQATVRAVWQAEFTVEGLGPFPVPGPALVQQQTVTVVVRSALAHLVG
jgi:hypothetical protein